MQNEKELLDSTNKLKLIPISESDTDNIIKWRNSNLVKQNLFGSDDVTPEIHLNWLSEYVMKGKCCQFIIHAEGTPVGTVFLKNIDYDNSKAEFGIFIGESTAHGKGYGTIAAKLITDFAFQELELNKIYLSVFNDNKGAIRSYEKVGFREEGILRQDYCKDGHFMDVLQMAMFRD